MILRIFKDIILFALIFSFINDNAMVDMLGGYSLKVIFALFLIVNLPDLLKFFSEGAKTTALKAFYIFLTIFTIVGLIQVIFLQRVDLMNVVMFVLAISVVFIYFTFYKEFDKLLYMIWGNVFISAIISLFNDPVEEFTFRVSGGTADPVEFSGHLFMGIFISFYLFKKNKNYIFLIIPNLLFLYAMLYAGSKTAFLIVAILGLYAAIVKFSNIFKYIFSFKGVISIVIIFVVFIQADLFNKIGAFKGIQERAKTQGTAYQRLVSWEAGLGMMRDYPFAGVGLDEYKKFTPKYLKDYLAVDGHDPHNIFVKIFAEAGMFTFLSFITFLFLLVKTKYFEILRSDYFWISLVSISAILMGMSIGIAYEKHFWLSLALLSNVILMFYQKDRQTYENRIDNV